MSEDRGNQLGPQGSIPGGPMGPMAQMMGGLGARSARDSENPVDSVMNQIPQRNGPDELGLRKRTDVSKAIYQKTVSARNMLDHIREEMDKLTNLADTVSPEDVIGAAGRLVGHGIPATELATLLADMPTQAGQGLAQWVQMHDQNARQQEQEVDRVRDISRHQLGVAALQELAGNHLVGHVRGRREQAQQMGGQLAPQGGGGMPQPNIMQVAQAPGREGAGAEEAI